MTMKPLRLRTYQGINGLVAYDACGRTWRTRQDGDKVAPVGVDQSHVIVDKLVEPKSK